MPYPLKNWIAALKNGTDDDDDNDDDADYNDDCDYDDADEDDGDDDSEDDDDWISGPTVLKVTLQCRDLTLTKFRAFHILSLCLHSASHFHLEMKMLQK